MRLWLFFFQAEDGIRDADVTGVQTCALPIADGTPFARQVATLEIRDATGRVAVGPIGSGTNPANGIAVVGNDMYHAVVPTTGLASGTYDLVLRFDASDVTGEGHRTLTLH